MTKTTESMDHHQWVMSDGTYGFGITDIAIGTLPSKPNGTSFARIVGLAEHNDGPGRDLPAHRRRLHHQLIG